MTVSRYRSRLGKQTRTEPLNADPTDVRRILPGRSLLEISKSVIGNLNFACVQLKCRVRQAEANVIHCGTSGFFEVYT
jgi:hypothetical protein